MHVDEIITQIEGKYLNWFNENKNKMLPINFKSFDELLTNTQSF
jgi:hypothetical protein